jgi:hypothetical protein
MPKRATLLTACSCLVIILLLPASALAHGGFGGAVARRGARSMAWTWVMMGATFVTSAALSHATLPRAGGTELHRFTSDVNSVGLGGIGGIMVWRGTSRLFRARWR